MQVLMLIAERGRPAMFARRRAGAERRQAEAGDHATPQARQALEDRQVKVLIYVDTSKEVGDVDHLKVFADDEAAEAWFKQNDPEGVAFEYEVMESKSPGNVPPWLDDQSTAISRPSD